MELNTYHTKHGKIVLHENCRLIDGEDEQFLYMDSNQQQEEQQTETTREISLSEDEDNINSKPLTAYICQLPESSSFVIYEPTPLRYVGSNYSCIDTIFEEFDFRQ